MYCKNCDIKYDTPVTKCLLCNNDLYYETSKIKQENFPKYEKKKNVSKFLYKLFSFLNFLSIIITIYIDYSLNKSLSWSLIVSISNIYLIAIMSIIYFKSRWITKIFFFIVLTSLEVLSIGFIIKDYHWAIDYVLPFSLIANILTLTLLFIINQKRTFDYISYLLLSSLLGVIPLLLNLFNVTNVKWPSTVASFYGLATLLSLFIFTPKQLKEEFLRKFHI